MKVFLRILAVLAVVGGGIGGCVYFKGSKPVVYKTEEATRGELRATIGATGTIEPEEVVDVGAQVAGIIIEFGPDRENEGKSVDYRTHVKKDDILARIDPTLYEADLESAKANVDAAEANVRKSQADVAQSQAKLEQAQRDWERAQKIGPSDALSQNDYDMYRANFEIARAGLAVSQATLDQARTGVVQSNAAMKRSQRNLDYCTIKSPVNGVIIARRVNIGQTVVSALNAPSLFLIAKDLSRVQVWASVNEADVGNIRPDQPVTYTVDAYPGETFHGKVIKMRYNATMTQNVVTYIVEIGTDNPGEKLNPYTTANVQFEVADHSDALLVTNAALRWYPDENQISAADKAQLIKDEKSHHAGGKSVQTSRGPATGTVEDKPATAAKGDATTQPIGREKRESSSANVPPKFGYVWVQDGKWVKPIRVRLGLTDGMSTEIVGGELTAGTKLIVGEDRGEAAAGTGRNPFMPQFGKKH